LAAAAVLMPMLVAPERVTAEVDAGSGAGPVPRATCGAGSRPETGLQGQVPLADRQDGRSKQGYQCNLELIGQHQGEGASWQNDWYDHCDYYDTALNPALAKPGVQVIDATDPAHPQLTANLTSPAMLGAWESLKVNPRRGLLGGVQGGPVWSAGFFDVYDVKGDCAHPRLLSSLPLPHGIIGHEGAWAPDGNTYYVGMVFGLAAIDVSDPTQPRLLYTDNRRLHGLSISADGTTAYLAQLSLMPGEENGLVIADVSQIQSRSPAPQVATLSTLFWNDGAVAQHTIPVRYDGQPFLVFVDEGGSDNPTQNPGAEGLRSPAGATRIMDISDPRHPKLVSKISLEIQQPANADVARKDVRGNGWFGYQAHYCSVDQAENPTALACGYFQSGIRVFDIRDPYRPTEISYFNPPAQGADARARLQGSEHANGPVIRGGPTALYGETDPPTLTTDYCTSQVRFYRPRNELWGQCNGNGFMALKFTNGAYPLEPLGAALRASLSAARARPASATLAPSPTVASPPAPVRRQVAGGFSAAVPAVVQDLAYACIIVPGLVR
jgi:hypothetical protein